MEPSLHPWKRPPALCALRLAAALVFGASGAARLAQSAGPFVTGAEPAMAGVDAGEVLLGELNCVSCHSADPGLRTRLASNQSPRLGAGGLRLTPQFLRAFLANPHGEKPGTTMPDLLHSFDAAQKKETVDALVHYLVSLHPADTNALVGADQFKIQTGRAIYHQVGCVACHAPQESASVLDTKPDEERTDLKPADRAKLAGTSVPLGPLARKTTVDQLARFLVDPLKVRPAGRMPSLNLTDGEATAIAMYLLREQATQTKSGAPPVRMKGLSYHYFEGNFSDTTKLDAAKVKASGLVEQFTLRPRARVNNIGFRFTGFIKVPADGDYTFSTSSDDGSRLYLGSQLVVDNDGTHGTTEKSGSIPLKAGDHPIMVAYFNGGGEAVLKVSWEGPGSRKQEVPSSALSTDQGRPMTPLDDEAFTLDDAKAGRGRELFTSLNCAACHQIGNEKPAGPVIAAKNLLDVNANSADGCLGNATKRGAAQFHLNGAQRAALRATLSAPDKLAQPRTPAQQVAHTLAALNCFACHARDGGGGPADGRADYFAVLGGVDLGDEGRIPPHLTRVGDKLRPDWLREVLVNKGAVRPYMAARMPQFGVANVAHLPAAFEAADSSSKTEPPADPADAKWGRRLVGTGGLSCISCHTFAGQKSLGVPALDLTTMTRRLKLDWFHRYLLDPPALRPGTRMPGFWPDGKSPQPDVLGGNPGRQINALWSYLARGKEGGLPPGLIQGKVELIASNEAVLYRNFIEGAGPRAIGVGYPEKANLAFDANGLRLAMIWQGPFLDAARHREGRGDGFVAPLGYNTVKLPSGPPFALLDDARLPWPDTVGKKGGYQMRGYRLDEKQRPAFLYTFQNVQIEDHSVAVPGDVDASLHRTLKFHAEPPPDRLWFRAWAGASVEAKGGNTYLADGKVTLRFTLPGGSQPLVRDSGGKLELLVPVVFRGSEAAVIEEINW